MKKLIILLLLLVQIPSLAETNKEILSRICSNAPVYLYFDEIRFDSGNKQKTESIFGVSSHRGLTKDFDKDSAALAAIDKAIKDACSYIERGVLMTGKPDAVSAPEEGAIHAMVSCTINSITSTVEERRDGKSWGGVWASIQLTLKIVDAFSGDVYFSDVLTSEGRSNGGFNINLSSVEDAAGRLSCFLGDDLRALFPIYGTVLEEVKDAKSSKVAFVVNLGSDDNVYGGGIGTYRVSKLENDGTSFRLVEMGSGYIYEVTSADRCIFRVTMGASNVKKAFAEGETLVIKSK